jgi:hypothetical protein
MQAVLKQVRANKGSAGIDGMRVDELPAFLKGHWLEIKDRLRLWKTGIRDRVMEICCALHNFRVRMTPWQPMI